MSFVPRPPDDKPCTLAESLDEQKMLVARLVVFPLWYRVYGREPCLADFISVLAVVFGVADFAFGLGFYLYTHLIFSTVLGFVKIIVR